MDIDEYQTASQETDQRPGTGDEALIVPLLGLVGEAGTLQAQFKKRLRDGDAHARFADHVEEELGDILWYVANVASKMGLSLGDIARKNLEKTRERWLAPKRARAMFDATFAEHEQLPREFSYTFAYRRLKDRDKVVLLGPDGEQVGDPLTDNADREDGYRFHDVLHMAHAAVLGWSPVLRNLLKRKRRANPKVDEVQDGGRAQVIDEAIVATIYEYADRHRLLDAASGVDLESLRVDWELLRMIKRLTAGLEVSVRSPAEWEDAILAGLRVWREVRRHDGGTVRGDLLEGTLAFVQAPEGLP